MRIHLSWHAHEHEHWRSWKLVKFSGWSELPFLAFGQGGALRSTTIIIRSPFLPHPRSCTLCQYVFSFFLVNYEGIYGLPSSFVCPLPQVPVRACGRVLSPRLSLAFPWRQPARCVAFLCCEVGFLVTVTLGLKGLCLWPFVAQGIDHSGRAQVRIEYHPFRSRWKTWALAQLSLPLRIRTT